MKHMRNPHAEVQLTQLATQFDHWRSARASRTERVPSPYGSKRSRCHPIEQTEIILYFPLPTDPPFIHQQERTARQQHLIDDLTAQEQWVLSLCGWGDVAISGHHEGDLVYLIQR